MSQRQLCIVYRRVSSDRQTTDNQMPDISRLVEAMDLEVRHVFDETAPAGKARPELNRMMAMAKRGDLRGYRLVLWSLDRLGRSLTGNLQLILDLEQNGCSVISVKEPWMSQDGPVRSLLLAVFSWVAEQERTRLSQRVIASVERARRAGKKLGRPRKFINVEEALRLRAQGLSIEDTAIRLGVGRSTLHRALMDRTKQSADAERTKEISDAA